MPIVSQCSEKPAYLPLTRVAQDQIRQQLRPGQMAIDATAGNGHDTVFLANLVGTSGRVFGFDVQRQALAHTRQRLLETALDNCVTLVLDGHENMQAHIPTGNQGGISAVMFNLGYLPNSDKQIITRPETTRTAIESAAGLLAAGGIMTILVYREHAGGQAEANAIERLLNSMNKKQFRVELHASPGPWLYVVEKNTPG